MLGPVGVFNISKNYSLAVIYGIVFTIGVFSQKTSVSGYFINKSIFVQYIVEEI